jgi:RNA polymerase sigma-70 factor (ECF subfamily)
MAAQESLNHKVFELIFDQNREMLERLAYFYVGSAEEAQDIVSQSFLTLWERREDIVSDRVLPYLFTIVKNACLDYRRKEEKHRQVHEQIFRQERAMMDIYTSTIESRDPVALFTGEILSIYKETLLSLPQEQRETWLRSRIDGLTYKEIAETLGVPYKRVDKNMQQVVKKLRTALSEYMTLILFLSTYGISL